MYRITDKLGDCETVFEGDTIDGVIALRNAANKTDKVDSYAPITFRYDPLAPKKFEFYVNNSAGIGNIVNKTLGMPIKGVIQFDLLWL